MKKYFIKTFGCAMNFSDSERLASFLESHQFKLASKIERADLAIFNTCGVRQMAEDRVYGQIHNLRRDFPETKIILTGCVAQRRDVQKRLKNKVDLFVSVKDFPKKVGKFLNAKNKTKKTVSAKNNRQDYFALQPKYSNKFSASVPIMTGCNNFCAYCVVPYARGPEISRPAEEILSEVKNLIKNGCKEITLLGQNVNSYRGTYHNKPLSFAELLKMINDLPGNFWLRFLTSHPKDMSDELIEVITSAEKVCEYVHLPIQAGDNTVLKRMNRKYTRRHYLDLIKKIEAGFAKNKPKTIYSLTTDIIVGFPGETKEQFAKSAEVMKQVPYDMVYFGQFSPRPGTAAWNMKDDVSKQEKARREKYLNEILKKSSYENNKKYVGKIFDILIEKEKNGFYYGKTRTLKNVKLPVGKIKNLIGKIVKAKITKANIWNLEGKITLPDKIKINNNKKLSEKILVILGPTAVGKSSLAIKLAKKFNGEIVSADSRQIYQGMEINSGAVLITKKEIDGKEFTISENIPHYFISTANPTEEYSVAKFKREAEKVIADILARKKLPIICGGTGFWIKAIVDNVIFPEVKPNWELRKKLEQKSTKELFSKLKKIDPARAKTVDAKNKVRLIRALEICQAIGKVPQPKTNKTRNWEFLQIGIKRPKEELAERIKLNVAKRMEQGMIAEIEELHKNLSWEKIESFGLSFKLIPQYLRKEISSQEELEKKIYLAEKNYAKRQMTWFKKDKTIKWLSDYVEIKKEVIKFLAEN